MPVIRWRSARLFIIASILLAAAHAQTAVDSCTTTENSTNNDVSLRLSLKNGQTVFREGEIIAMDAEYSSSAEKKYYLNTRGYDRSGRLSGMEVFCLEPDPAIDPLSDYFDGIMGFIGGGLGGNSPLINEPVPIHLELNEWKSLPPGSYHLRIASQRVNEPTEKSTGPYGALVPLRSNTVEFQVVKAEPEWQAEQLAAALQPLDSGDPTSEDAKHAARVLRFLGSESSTRTIAQRYWSSNDQPFGWDIKFGLFGSRYRSVATETMKAALKDPQHPVTQEFIQTLTLLELESDPKTRMPKYDPNNKEAWTRARDAHTAAFNKLIAQYSSEAAAVVQSKTGLARAVTVNELLQSDVPLNPAARTQLRQMLLASWDALPVRRRNELVEFRWEQIRGPELLPILKNIVAGEPNPNRMIDKLNREPALRHIYEMSPSEGRDLILREIAHPEGDISIKLLAILPDRELPQIEQPLIAKFKKGNGTEIDYQLIWRYASAHAFPAMKSIYEDHRGEWACSPQSAILRYFLRVQPDYGAVQVSDALYRRQTTGCFRFLFTELEEDLRRPRVEEIAIRALDDSSPDVTSDAAQALQKFGSARVEPALWLRLEKFHEQWKNKPEQLQYRPGANPDLVAQGRLGSVLVQAISNGQAWLASEQTISRLKQLASPQMQPELDGVLQEMQRGEYGVNLNWWPAGTLDYSVGRYSGKGMAALKEKLAQLPAGSRLNCITTIAQHERHRAEFTEVEDTATAHGLIFQLQTPQ
jgi:hypothetical protein